MERFKQIIMFAVLIVIFAIFSDFMIKVGLRNTYKRIPGDIKISAPEITVSEAKSTDINGYINGTIKNNTEQDIDHIYIKIDFYSKRNVNLGTEYYEIKNLNKNSQLDFEVKFKYSRVDHYEINCVKEK